MHTRPTSYKIDSSVDDELVYLRWQISRYDRLRGYDCRVPPSLVDRVNNGQRLFADEELRQAIVGDAEPGSSMDELRGEWASQAKELFESFFARMLQRPPYFLKVHITKYGPGGSYHPTGLPGHPGRFITIKEPRIAKLPASFNQVIVHETIELLIHDEIERRRTSHDVKEAIVDQFCSCSELQAVYEKYPKQSRFAAALPDDWRSYIEWQPGESPSWD
ncbi:hypothetical protein LUI11_35035 [Bradyrhizobium diazoefficiens]|uniref:Uncharacterized protein n=1 Tax=Bradyrhizobium diazoefficiens TaxID=1355477 RepID=A0A810AEY7_9BRAD|nr:hypothetical protein [Bradyrhizobium diazoefficiens]APO49720.1 hypothetical protein BD122_05765 [Bradyrhizobium diazoefficiens]KOY12372.1 hypothetical protein AF336_04405 [Bradyrhizobium diazoefficiens]MCD9296209.1 hypothetical protein [Bradyrhizobium diazoefficiens]MCD9813017.1 hypothetical protein [Bradyrhizobium diazoefficiens]MCD9831742.1 hypothetical protein [Bradyrhizobium diazoefficiens]